MCNSIMQKTNPPQVKSLITSLQSNAKLKLPKMIQAQHTLSNKRKAELVIHSLALIMSINRLPILI